MNVSFDGMRKNASHSMNRLQDLIDSILIYSELSEDFTEDLKERFNDAAMSVDMFNCLFDDSVEDDMNDLSEKLDIKRFDT